jgi:hypothetical protein
VAGRQASPQARRVSPLALERPASSEANGAIGAVPSHAQLPSGMAGRLETRDFTTGDAPIEDVPGRSRPQRRPRGHRSYQPVDTFVTTVPQFLNLEQNSISRMEFDVDLKGSRCLVTGAGRGAGWGIALALAEQGADVAVCDLDLESAEATAGQVADHGVRSLAMKTDVASESEVNAMVDRTVEEFGGIDVLVNTVAWIDPPGPVVSMPTRGGRRVYAPISTASSCARSTRSRTCSRSAQG